MTPHNHDELDGMPEPDVLIVYNYRHSNEGAFATRSNIPEMSQPMPIPKGKGEVTRIIETRSKEGYEVFTVTVTEDTP